MIRRIIYTPFVNRIIRGVLRILGSPKKYWIPVSGTLSFKTDKGQPFRLSTNQTCNHGRLIYWNGPANFEFSSIFMRLIRECEVFFDIGANMGYYSVLAATCNPKLRVFSFEPSNGPWAYLNENVRLNGLKQVKPFKLALSNGEGEIQFYESFNPKYPWLKHHLSGTSNILNSWGEKNTKQYNVKTRTLNEFVETEKVEKLDLIKIDTEGTEHMVFEKGMEVVERFRPVIICEVLHGKVEQEIERLFSGRDYLWFQYKDDGLHRVESLKPESDDHFRNFFFVPKEKEPMIEAFKAPAKG